jgi:hypothetical protein
VAGAIGRTTFACYAATLRSALTFPGKGGHRGGGESADPIFFDRIVLIHSSGNDGNRAFGPQSSP